jgi:hypothetical protein
MKKFGAFRNNSFRKKNHLPRAFSKGKFFLRFTIFFTILLLLIAIFVVFKSDFFKIKTITVDGNYDECTTSIDIFNESKLRGESIFVVNEKSVAEKVLKKFICLSSVTVIKKLPDKVTLTATKREPLAVIGVVPKDSDRLKLDLQESTPSSQTALINFKVQESSISAFFISDEKGFLYKKIDGFIDGLPTIFIAAVDLKVGNSLPIGVEGVLKITAKLKELGLNFETVKLEQGDVLVDGVTDLAFSQSRDIDKQLAALQLILIKAKINSEDESVTSREFERIDLRFDRPVVVYKSRR